MGLRYKVRALLAGSKVTRKDRRSHGRVRRAIRGSRHPQLDGSFATANESGKARIAILDRADVNTEQSRVYDAAKQSTGIVGGPYSYIRLPKLFEACVDRAGRESALEIYLPRLCGKHRFAG